MTAIQGRPLLTRTLDERSAEYGDYVLMAQVAQDLKAVMHRSVNWGRGTALGATKQESLDLIATKIARILCGNPNNVDSWLDIEGYARKARETIRDREPDAGDWPPATS